MENVLQDNIEWGRDDNKTVIIIVLTSFSWSSVLHFNMTVPIHVQYAKHQWQLWATCNYEDFDDNDDDVMTSFNVSEHCVAGHN